ncbi:MAG TPA: hypothetical protein VMT50_01735, partial [Steroidobacteraceae bacterium]|nr:hypothetical protein [Steroidobacteraceae bacterium]
LTLLLAMLALFLARWWQSQLEHPGAFGPEFGSLRLGLALGASSAVVIVASLVTKLALVDDIARLFMGALVLVGLGAAHRAAQGGRLASGWLWGIYLALVLVAPVTVAVLAAWGFADNWRRSRETAQVA